jgi:histidine triad (HIT) family protein
MQKEKMSDCIFCKIIKGEILAAKIYENDKIIAFLDIAPVNPGHTLVVSKEHYENLLSTPEEILCEMISKVKSVAKAVISGMDAEGFNLGVNNGKVAGQIIPHLHFHIMPRYTGDGRKLWLGEKSNPKELEKIAQKIKNSLKSSSP